MKIKGVLSERGKKNLKNTILALQHTFAMMGATILVPILCNLSVSITLICAGIGTLVFYLVSGRKVPVFLGSSFAFIGAIVNVIPSADKAPIGSELWLQSIGKMSTGIMMAGLVYLAIAVIVKIVGVKKVKSLFPPVVIGPIIMVIGLNLAPVVFKSYIVGQYAENPALKPKIWAVVVVTALVIVVVSSFFRKGFISTIGVLLGMTTGYILACILGIVDFTPIKNADWIFFQSNTIKVLTFYKYITFDVSTIAMFMPLALVTCMEHIGDISVNSAIVGKNFLEDPGLHRTLTGDGLATIIAGFLGGPVNTTYGENTAVLAITKNYNPNVIALAGGVAIILGIFGKVGGIIATIPSAVIGGASMILFGMIAANGLKVLVDNRVDFTKPRNTFVVSLILVIGVGMGASGMSLKIKTVEISPLALVTVLGVLINLVFTIADKYKGEKAYKDEEKKEILFYDYREVHKEEFERKDENTIK